MKSFSAVNLVNMLMQSFPMNVLMKDFPMDVLMKSLPILLNVLMPMLLNLLYLKNVHLLLNQMNLIQNVPLLVLLNFHVNLVSVVVEEVDDFLDDFLDDSEWEVHLVQNDPVSVEPEDVVVEMVDDFLNDFLDDSEWEVHQLGFHL